MEKFVYLDNAATTAVRKEIMDAIYGYYVNDFGNASSMYKFGKKSRNIVEEARKQVAYALGADAEEIYFTCGGTESDNWAIRGAANSKKKQGKHIITSQIEHHAVLHTCEFLEKMGYEITYLPVDVYGIVSLDALKNAIREDTILISIMYANNEVGTLQPMEEIAQIAKKRGILLHTDAVQAVGHVPINVHELGVDMLSLSGHKLGAPKGIGALYIKKGTDITPFMFGGAQEKKMRAGTENVPAIAGLGLAAKLAAEEMEAEIQRLESLRDKLIEGLLKVPHSKLNGHPTKRLPGNCNISFDYIEGESALMLLDAAGICASSGSACTAGSGSPSHVLTALGLNREETHGSIRFTLGLDTREEDIDYAIEKIPEVVGKLRSMSPMFQ